MITVSNYFIHSKSSFSFKDKIYLVIWRFVYLCFFRTSLHGMKKWRIFLLKLFGAKIGQNCFIDSSVNIYIPKNLEMGNNSAIGFDSLVYSLDKIKIGDFVSILQRVHLNTGTHNTNSPAFELITKPITINDGAFIGTDTFINLGVSIGQFTVIGARSVVTKDMPDEMICVGHPCKPIKPRFQENE